MRVGILGGYFDPIHNGHIELARFVLDNCPFDHIWITPVYNNISSKTPQEYYHRLNMCKLACEGYRKISASNIENILEAKNTYNLLNKLKKYPYDIFTFYMIIGMDEANKINTWVNYEKLIKEHTFVVVDREGTARNTDWFINKHIYLRDRYNIIPNISSSELRREIKMDLDFHSDLLNYKVVKYIKRYKLYE